MADTVPFQMRVPRVLMERLRALSSERGTTVTDLLLGPWSLPTFEERPASPAVEVTPPVGPVGPAFVTSRAEGRRLAHQAIEAELSRREAADRAAVELDIAVPGPATPGSSSLPPPLLVPVSPKVVVEPFFRGGSKKRSGKGK